MLRGVDVSQYQGDIDFTKISVDFLITKVNEGIGSKWVDSRFIRNQTECRKKGIGLGYYQFVRPDLGNKAEDEADFFLTTIGELKEGELLFLDFEVSYSDCVAWCKKWLDRVFLKTKCKPLIYLNQSQIHTYNWQPIIDAGYGLWAAIYDYVPDTFGYSLKWPVIAFKQYTNKLQISGIVGNVDGDSFNGDLETMKKYGFHKETTPDNTSGDLAICLTNCQKIQNELELAYGDRDKWKKSWNDLEIIYTQEGAKKDEIIKENDKTIKDLTGQVARLQETLSTCKPPLSEYSVWERIKSLFGR